jgi:thiol-disulfide isomerase/thioredoxin
MTSTPTLDVAVLCAAWCGTCREYQQVYAQLQTAMPGHRYHWIDVEDQDELCGDLDIETFPTLMVAHEGRLLFGGIVLPRLADGQRLIEAQQERVAQGPAVKAQVEPEQRAAFEVLAGHVAGLQPDA